MSKQKSMGQVLCDKLKGIGYWEVFDNFNQSRYQNAAAHLIAEHERRKRAPCEDCTHAGGGSCKSCRYFMAKHAPSYFERKRAKAKRSGKK